MTVIHQFPVLIEFLPGSCGKSDHFHFLRNFTSSLSESYRPCVVLDLSMTTLTDPLDIDALSRCIEEIAARDGELSLIAPLAQTRLVLELTRIDRIARVFVSTEETKTELGIAELNLLGEMPREFADKGGTKWAA